MIKEIIVVEGKDDTTAIRRAVEAETIETGGSAVNAQIIRKIALANERRGIIIFTDPDHAGERIRKIISAAVPGCKHAFLPLSEAEHKGDIGVENASPEAIRHALEHVRTECIDEESDISWEELITAGLIVHPQAASRRLALGNILGIGYCNGKQLYKRCKMFRISKIEFSAAMQQMNANEDPE